MDFNVINFGQIVSAVRAIDGLSLVRVRMAPLALVKFKRMMTVDAQCHVLHDPLKQTVFGVRIDYDHALSGEGYMLDFSNDTSKWIPYQ
jgi:hypothetical protein